MLLKHLPESFCFRLSLIGGCSLPISSSGVENLLVGLGENKHLLFGVRWLGVASFTEPVEVLASPDLQDYFFSNGKCMKKKRRMIDFKKKNIIFD